MPDNERRPGESIAQWRRRIIQQNRYGDNGGELNPAIVTADRPDQKPTGNWFQRIGKFIKPYGTEQEVEDTFLNENYQLYADANDEERLKDPDFAEDLFNRLSAFKTLDQRKAIRKNRIDEYRGNYGGSLFPNFTFSFGNPTTYGAFGNQTQRIQAPVGNYSNPNDPFSIGWRWWSRHFGYEKELEKNEHEAPFSGEGTDIVDLSKNTIRMTPDSQQSNGLFNEFMENNPSIYPARKYQNKEVESYGDNKLDPNKVNLYAGIEDGRFRADSLQNFKPDTEIFPVRNVKKHVLPIKRIGFGSIEGVPEKNKALWETFKSNIDYNWYKWPTDSSIIKEKEEYLKDAADKIDSLINAGNYAEATELINGYPGIYSYDKNYLKTVNNWARRGEITPDYYIPPRLLNIRDRLHNVYRNANSKLNSKDDLYYIDTNGEKHSFSEYGVKSNGKLVIVNPNGGMFYGNLNKINQEQADSTNAYLSKNPSWILLPDRGGFSKYYLDNPSLAQYTSQYYGVNPSDPNLFAVGTTTPNTLWPASKKQGGNIPRLQDGKSIPFYSDQSNTTPYQYPDWQNGDNCPTGQCAFFSNSQLRDYLGVPAYGNAWTLNGEPLYTNPIPKPIDSSKSSYFKYWHKSADRFASDFDFSQLKPYEAYQVNLYYNGSPSWDKAAPTGNGTHAGYLEFKNGQWNVVHNIHGKVHVDKLKDILGGNQKSYGVLNIYRVPGFNMKDAYKQQLDDYVSKNPMGIWTEDSANVRTWLRKNSPETLQNYWNNLTDEQRKRVDRRFKP